MIAYTYFTPLHSNGIFYFYLPLAKYVTSLIIMGQPKTEKPNYIKISYSMFHVLCSINYTALYSIQKSHVNYYNFKKTI